eukprot:7939778-Lingulodinium_polyedra.AAC.1
MEEATMEIEPPPGLPGPLVSQAAAYWTKEGTTLIRHYVIRRVKLFRPTPMSDGPDAARLEDARMTEQ